MSLFFRFGFVVESNDYHFAVFSHFGVFCIEFFGYLLDQTISFIFGFRENGFGGVVEAIGSLDGWVSTDGFMESGIFGYSFVFVIFDLSGLVLGVLGGLAAVCWRV